MKKLYISILNYNGEKDTGACLKSLSACITDGIDLHVVVVDNHSLDGFSLREVDFPKLKLTLIKNPTNEGFSGGHNRGIIFALQNNADYIMVLNNDTIVDNHFIVNLVAALEKESTIGVVTPKIYFTKGHEFHKDRYTEEDLGKVIWYAGGKTDWQTATSVHRGVDEVDHGQYDTTEKIAFATGCCMLFKREVFEKAGLFDERYFLYYEDADISERIKKVGYTIFYVPNAVIYHNNAGASGGAGNSLQDYFMTRNQMLFGIKYAPLRTKIALLRQSKRLLLNGRMNQKMGIKDYYAKRFGKGTFFEKEKV